MVAAEMITTEEAALLLDQIGEPRIVSSKTMGSAQEGRMLRVRMEMLEESRQQPTHVNVNLPLKAAKLASGLIQKTMPTAARDAMRKEGVDLNDMDLVELIDAIADTGGDIVNIAIDNEKSKITVRIYVE